MKVNWDARDAIGRDQAERAVQRSGPDGSTTMLPSQRMSLTSADPNQSIFSGLNAVRDANRASITNAQVPWKRFAAVAVTPRDTLLTL